jgi:hypothetical protein
MKIIVNLIQDEAIKMNISGDHMKGSRVKKKMKLGCLACASYCDFKVEGGYATAYR